MGVSTVREAVLQTLRRQIRRILSIICWCGPFWHHYANEVTTKILTSLPASTLTAEQKKVGQRHDSVINITSSTPNQETRQERPEKLRPQQKLVIRLKMEGNE
ncbi:hypothetical protein JZ751_009829, partial [Albula glossodonta]